MRARTVPKYVPDAEKLIPLTASLTRREIDQLQALADVAKRNRGEQLRIAIRYYLEAVSGR